MDVFVELPQKKTFIDYPPPPMARPSTPTSSAPAFLQRFKNLRCPEAHSSQEIEVVFHRAEISGDFDSGSSTDCPSDEQPQDAEEANALQTSTGPAGQERRRCWKAGGCSNGEGCKYCHLRPLGTLNAVKNVKVGPLGMQGVALGQQVSADGTCSRSFSVAALTLAKNDRDAFSNIDSRKVPVKNTFIQFELPSSPTGAGEPPLSTAPGNFFKRLFHTKEQAVLPAPRFALDAAPQQAIGSGTQAQKPDIHAADVHGLGHCTPCSYFRYKKDGCRKGEACSFCHSCPKGEIKQRKKHRMQELKAAGVFRKGFSKMDVGESGHWVQVSL